MATNQQARVVPGIPLAALAAIKDENARQVLQALIDGWHVRNGASGGGDNRFITAAEAGLTGGRSAIAAPGAGQAGAAPGAQVKPADIARIINDLQALVMESTLFKALGERVDLIDRPKGVIDQLADLDNGVKQINTISATSTSASAEAVNSLKVSLLDPVTGVPLSTAAIAAINNVSATSTSASAKALAGVIAQVIDPATGKPKAEALVTDEKSTRANQDNALANAINTIWAAVGSSSALVTTGASGVANVAGAVAANWAQVQAAVKDAAGNVISSAAVKQSADSAVTKTGEINAKYTVKIDANGYVSGYGLISEANNSTPYSDFTVRADRFAVGSPSGPGIAPQIPFIVLTTPTAIGGQTVPSGVYLDTAFIKNGSIGNAKIGNAEVGTLKIGSNAVTVPVTASGGARSGTGIGSFSIINEAWVTLDFPGCIYAHCLAAQWYGSGIRYWNMKIEISNNWGMTIGGQSVTVAPAVSMSKQLPAGTYYVRVWWAGEVGVSVSQSELFAMGVKR